MAELTRVALDLCERCLKGNREVNPAFPSAVCRNEDCALYECVRPYEGLREHVKVMWPAPLMACVEALRRITEGMEASGGWEGDDELFDMGMEALAALDHYLEGEPAAQEER